MEEEEAIYDEAGCGEMTPSVQRMRAMFDTPVQSKAPDILRQRQKNHMLNGVSGPPPSIPAKTGAASQKQPSSPKSEEASGQAGSHSLLEKRPSSRETIWPPVMSLPSQDSTSDSKSATSPVSSKPPPAPSEPSPASSGASPGKRAGSIKIPDAFQQPNNKPPVLKPKPKVGTKPKLSPGLSSPTSPKPTIIKGDHKSDSQQKETNNNEVVKRASRKSAVPTLEPSVTFGSQVYRLLPLENASRDPPSKPQKPSNVDLEKFIEEEDEDLYDDVGAFTTSGMDRVSRLPTYDDEEDEVKRQSLKFKALDKDLEEDEELYDTVGPEGSDCDDVYDDPV